MKKNHFNRAWSCRTGSLHQTSVSYEQPGEIALAPVTRANMTKAAITGATFPTTNDMGVYAFYNTVDAGTTKENFHCKFSCLSEQCEIY